MLLYSHSRLGTKSSLRVSYPSSVDWTGWPRFRPNCTSLQPPRSYQTHSTWRQMYTPVSVEVSATSNLSAWIAHRASPKRLISRLSKPSKPHYFGTASTPTSRTFSDYVNSSELLRRVRSTSISHLVTSTTMQTIYTSMGITNLSFLPIRMTSLRTLQAIRKRSTCILGSENESGNESGG